MRLALGSPRVPTVISALGVGLLLVSTACSSRPEDQIAAAQKSMEAAKEQRAAEFAPSEWADAEAAWKDAQALLAKESYSQAGARYQTAKGRFDKARNIAKSKRDAVIREVDGLQKTIDKRYATLKSGIESGGGRLSPQRKKTLEDACKEIDKGVDRLKAEVGQGEYTAAKSTAQTTMRQVYDTEKELEGYLGVSKKKSS
jgi:hypothetical protein